MVTWKCQVTFSVERPLFLCSLSMKEYKGGDVTWLTDLLSEFLPSEALPLETLYFWESFIWMEVRWACGPALNHAVSYTHALLRYRLSRASSVLPELISLAVLQSLPLLTPRTPPSTAIPVSHTGRRECTQDGWEGTASLPPFPGRVWGERGTERSRLSPLSPLSLPSPGPAAAAGWQQPPAGEGREERRERRQEERERGEDAGTGYGAECLPVPR